MFGERQRDLVFEQFPQEPRLFFYPDLPYINFADVTLFPWRRELESRYRAVNSWRAKYTDSAGARPMHLSR